MSRKIQADLEVKDNGSQVVEKFSRNVDSSFSKIGASVISMNQALELAGKAWETIEKTFAAAKLGQELSRQEQAFGNLARASNTSMNSMLADLNRYSQGMVANSELIKSAGTSMLLGVPAEKLSELMKIAAASSKMTGLTVQQSFDNISMGVARGSKMLLDNLGIVINLDDSYQKYAETLGKSASQLSDTEKKQALLNSTIEAGNKIIKQVGSDDVMAGAVRLTKEWTDLTDSLVKSLGQGLNPVMELLAGTVKKVNEELAKGPALIEKFKSMSDEQFENYKPQPGSVEARVYAQERYQRGQRLKKEAWDNSEGGRFGRGNPFLKIVEDEKAQARNEVYADSGRFRNYARDTTIVDPGYLATQAEIDKEAAAAAQKATKEATEALKKHVDAIKAYSDVVDSVTARLDENGQAIIGISESGEHQESRYSRSFKASQGNYAESTRVKSPEEMAKENKEFFEQWNKDQAEWRKITQEIEKENKAKEMQALTQFSEALQENMINPLVDLSFGLTDFKSVLSSLTKDLLSMLNQLASTGGESGGSGMFGTLFNLAKIGISAYSGGGIGTNSTAYTFQDPKMANGGIFNGSFMPISAFSSGGIARKPTLGLIGEGGQNEAVVPLPNGRSIPVQMHGDSSGGAPGSTIIVNAMGASSFADYLRKNSGALVGAITAMANKGNRGLSSALRRA